MKNVHGVSNSPPCDLKPVLYRTIHGSRLSVEQIADAIGISASYLYRSTLQGESGCRFPADFLLRLMQATQDYSALDFLARECGSLLVNIPRARSLKRMSRLKLLLAIESSFTDLMRRVLQYVERPEPRTLPEIKRTLRSHLAELSALRLALETYSQRELDF